LEGILLGGMAKWGAKAKGGVLTEQLRHGGKLELPDGCPVVPHGFLRVSVAP